MTSVMQKTLKIPQKNVKISVTFLHTNNKQSENEVNHSIYNSIKKNKILRNKLNQEVKDLYTESCVTLLKKMKRDK